ncbi:hypothetical protein K432DRAFT_311306, partial [Lepidopterella palustris CBS 459.81]
LTNVNNNSAFECWQLYNPFKTALIPGIIDTASTTIGNFTNIAYTILPARFNGGIHNAPVPQIAHFVSGLAHVTLPHNSSTEAWVLGDVGGLLLAFDTKGTGHITTYPSDQTTVAIAMPFAGGQITEHVVIGKGPCGGLETLT